MAKLVNDEEIVTAGRDGYVKLWHISEDSINDIASYKEHEGFVNSVAYIPSIPEYPEGKGKIVFCVFIIFVFRRCYC